MKKTDLFEVAIKIFGFYELLEAVLQLANVVQSIVLYRMEKIGLENEEIMIYNGILISYLFLSVLLGLFLISKSRMLARKLAGTSEDDKTLNIPLDSRAILQIALVVCGLFLIIWTLPQLVSDTLVQINRVQHDFPGNERNNNYLWFACSKLIIGILLAVYSDVLANWFSRKEAIK